VTGAFPHIIPVAVKVIRIVLPTSKVFVVVVEDDAAPDEVVRLDRGGGAGGW
jgi:hypothetical protein